MPLLINTLFLYDLEYMSHNLWMYVVIYKISETTLKHILIPSSFKIIYYEAHSPLLFLSFKKTHIHDRWDLHNLNVCLFVFP